MTGPARVKAESYKLAPGPGQVNPPDAYNLLYQRLGRISGLTTNQRDALAQSLDPDQVEQVSDAVLAQLVSGTLPTQPLNPGAGLPLGLPGATQGARFVGGTVSGAPTTGTFAVRDWVVSAAGTFYVCTVAGSPGTWVQVSGGGGGASDATTSAKGVVQLAGDLGGTAASPTVPGLAGKVNAAGAAAAAPVQTVAGKTGAVSLVKGDVGLGNVDNTADTAKPVSTAQQTALDAKAPLASPALTGTPTAPTATPGTNTTQVATTAFVAAQSGTSVPADGSLTPAKLAPGATTPDGTKAYYGDGAWKVPAGGGSVSDATSSAKGVVQLAGDLAGTAAAPTVPGKMSTNRLPVHVDAFGADPTGAADSSAAFQQAFDANPHVTFGPGTYKLAASIFLDNPSSNYLYTLRGVGQAVLSLAAGLATTDSSVLDVSTGWAFFSNTNRAALSAGKVTTDDANRSSGGAFPSAPRLVVSDCRILGNSLNAGLVYSNTAAVRFERGFSSGLKYGTSWRGYSDGNSASNWEVKSQPVGGWFLLQTDPGDGVVLQDIKGSGSGIWQAYTCNGARLVGGVGGFIKLTNCAAVTVEGWHTELDEPSVSYPSFATISNTELILDGCFFQSGKGGTAHPMVQINDSTVTTDYHSQLTLRDTVCAFYLRSTDTDPVRTPEIQVLAAGPSMRIRSERSHATVLPQGSTMLDRESLNIDGSAVSGMAAAIAAGRHLIAGRHWELSQSSSTGWKVRA